MSNHSTEDSKTANFRENLYLLVEQNGLTVGYVGLSNKIPVENGQIFVLNT